jgi:hypothetical protein
MESAFVRGFEFIDLFFFIGQESVDRLAALAAARELP